MIRLLLLVMVSILAAGQSARPAPSGVEGSPIAPLAEELAKFRLERNPVLRLRQGLQVERLPDLSPAQAERDAAFGRSFMDRLNRIDPKDLSHEDWLTREILRWEAEDLIETRFDGLPFLVLPYSTPIRGVQQVFALLPVREATERERYLSLLKQYAEVLGQIRARTAD
jgi:uncharacterized protein (DUF885 family)